MALTMATALAGCALVIAQGQFGAGRHRGDVDPDIYMIGMKLNFISQPTYLFAICFVKLAVGFSLLRIASTKFYRYLIRGIMGFMLFYTIGCFFVSTSFPLFSSFLSSLVISLTCNQTIIFQCTDIRVLWDPSIKSVCWGMKTLQGLSYTNVALNILTDLLFAVIIPIPMLWNLNVNHRTRLSLLAILGLGVFACAAAIVKVGYIVNYGKVGDFLWDSRDITIWTAAETNVGIVAGSLPTLRPLFKRFLGSVYGKGSKKTSTSGHIYAHGTQKSGKQWQTLSGGGGGHISIRRNDTFPDDTSSREAIAVGSRGDDFELQDGFHVKTTIVATQKEVPGIEERKRSSSSGFSGKGIQKTTTTTISR
jgi:hypothetical protein